MNDHILNSLSKTTIFISLILLLQPLAGTTTTSLPRIVSFENGFTQLFGGDTNLLRSDDDNTVHLHLDQYTGAGFRSSDLYNHGLFSAKIKLPSDYTAGIVVAFYTCGDPYLMVMLYLCQTASASSQTTGSPPSPSSSW
ncbi:concanavalin A-like lectin/glucanase domain, Xyloglucan endotransglucosylase/hydrolase [Artemisia annua]|uniref:Concanavalin A-like lectin/glucanase domain, Xyloglucan endotransglucosylase/hydrolase n=1 Tax=Artemisia annua TaxID=35608 RepID=A0A2U1M0S9_ARTAN|nr:concanavalin A-like lectin/glucanase domain, Xyloglucan endotransglucosylase/hydrolase [Artemisia annua]